MNDQPSALASTLIVREVSIEDARAIAHVYVETARKQYAAIVARCAFARLSVGPLVRRWELLLMRRRWVRTAHIVENRAGRVVGFSAAGLTRVPCLQPAAELYSLYVLPESQGQGLGRLLFNRAVASLAVQGFESIVTRVLVANPARGFFEALGGQWIGSTSSLSLTPKVAYRWSDLTLRPRRAEHAKLEREARRALEEALTPSYECRNGCSSDAIEDVSAWSATDTSSNRFRASSPQSVAIITNS
jgi:ribosomal protein S18 acetylase RimI-like enzyme